MEHSEGEGEVEVEVEVEGFLFGKRLNSTTFDYKLVRRVRTTGTRFAVLRYNRIF